MRVTRETWRAWAALAVALTVCGPAHAFYWQDWPGSGLRTQPPITTSQPPAQTPPSFPGSDQPPPAGPPGPPVGPNPTPEPATGLLGLLGLGVLGAAKRWKRK